MAGLLGGFRCVAAVPPPARPRFARACTTVATGDVALVPTPIEPAWRLDGGDVLTEAAEIARAEDGTTVVYLWQTTRAHFRWEHESDEIVTVLAGEAYLSDRGAPAGMRRERRLGPGDVAFFPAGSRTEWRVPERLRKVSTLVRPLPPPLAQAMRWLRAGKRRFVQVRAASARRMSRAGSSGR